MMEHLEIKMETKELFFNAEKPSSTEGCSSGQNLSGLQRSMHRKSRHAVFFKEWFVYSFANFPSQSLSGEELEHFSNFSFVEHHLSNKPHLLFFYLDRFLDCKQYFYSCTVYISSLLWPAFSFFFSILFGRTAYVFLSSSCVSFPMKRNPISEEILVNNLSRFIYNCSLFSFLFLQRGELWYESF